MPPPETVNTAPPDPAAASSPIRILLVEDDDGDALLVQELLAISGARVEIVRADTLADARRENLEHVDCVLLDLDLPDAQGLTALHALNSAAAAAGRSCASSRKAARPSRPGRCPPSTATPGCCDWCSRT